MTIIDQIIRDLCELPPADPDGSGAIIVTESELQAIFEHYVGSLQRQATAGMELAEYASYAEIVGGVSVNREHIRKYCDAVFAAAREIEDKAQD